MGKSKKAEKAVESEAEVIFENEDTGTVAVEGETVVVDNTEVEPEPEPEPETVERTIGDTTVVDYF